MRPSRQLSESFLKEQLEREGVRPERWSNGPHAVYGVHDHPYAKVLVVVSGDITFTLESSKQVVPMATGDRLHIPARTPHSALVGADGVVCLEAHLPQGVETT